MLRVMNVVLVTGLFHVMLKGSAKESAKDANLMFNRAS